MKSQRIFDVIFAGGDLRRGFPTVDNARKERESGFDARLRFHGPRVEFWRKLINVADQRQLPKRDDAQDGEKMRFRYKVGVIDQDVGDANAGTMFAFSTVELTLASSEFDKVRFVMTVND